MRVLRRHFCRVCNLSAVWSSKALSMTISTSLRPAVNPLLGYSSGKPVQDQLKWGCVLLFQRFLWSACVDYDCILKRNLDTCASDYYVWKWRRRWDQLSNENRKRSGLYFEFSNTKHVRVDSRKDTGHVYVQEMKRYGTESSVGGKQYSWVALMMELKETGYPVHESISPLNRWILRRKTNRDIIYFNVDALHGKEQNSERFVTKENEQRLNNLYPQEVNTPMQTLRSDDPTLGNRLRGCL